MILVTINKRKQILLFSFIGRVLARELTESREDVVEALAMLSPDFRVVTDLTHLDLLDKDCVEEISRTMELCDQKGVALLVRVIPDPTKDIGLNILASFHYEHRPRTVTCSNMIEAAKALGI
jgi:anti-anti-sigma regulatory factor